MSAHTYLVFYGIQLKTNDINQLIKHRNHAQEHGLDTWETREDKASAEDTLFVGRIISVTGIESDKHHILKTSELEQMINKTQEQLKAANFGEDAALHTVFILDQ